MAELRSTHVGAYIETETKKLVSTHVGAYVETEKKELFVTHVGAYVETETTPVVPVPQGVVDQNPVEVLILPLSAVRTTQLPLEAVISDVIKDAKLRGSQVPVEVLMLIITTPSVASIYGPLVQAV